MLAPARTLIDLRRRFARDAGFSVLEALVAMALLAGAFLPLLQIQAQFVRTTESVERAQVRIEQRDLSRTFLETVNFAQEPTGEVTLGAHTLVWESVSGNGEARVRGVDGNMGRFWVSLYTVEASVWSAEADNRALPPENRFELRGLGWRPVGRAIESL